MERTDRLARTLGISLRQLAPVMQVSVASLFGYRSGAIGLSNKAWSKLDQAERKAEKECPGAGVAEWIGKPKQAGIGETTHVVREDPAVYGKRRPRNNDEEITQAFAKIREGLDLLEKLMKK